MDEQAGIQTQTDTRIQTDRNTTQKGSGGEGDGKREGEGAWLCVVRGGGGEGGERKTAFDHYFIRNSEAKNQEQTKLRL